MGSWGKSDKGWINFDHITCVRILENTNKKFIIKAYTSKDETENSGFLLFERKFDTLNEAQSFLNDFMEHCL